MTCSIFYKTVCCTLLPLSFGAIVLLSGCSDDSPVTPPVTAEPPPTDIPPIEDGAALANLPDDCHSSPLCRQAVNAANKLAATPKQTCYQSEASEQSSGSPSPEIDINADTPFAYVSGSGWLHYALNQAGATLFAATDEISAFSDPQYNWIRAHEYYLFFTQIATGETTSENWHADADLNELRVGDVLSWCLGKWCEGSDANGHGGHVSIVVSVEPTTREELASDAFFIPNNSKFWRIGIVDSHSSVHGNNSGETAQIKDLRHYGGSLHNGQCDINGGLGAGEIIVAQWNNDANERQWAYMLKDSINHHFFTAETYAKPQIAFGRPL